MLHVKPTATITIIIMAAVLSACGSGTPQVSSQDGYDIAHANLTLAQYCVHDLQGVNIPSSELEERDQALDTLIRVYRKNPAAVYKTSDASLTMRQLLSDRATSLSHNCWERGAGDLNQALTAG